MMKIDEAYVRISNRTGNGHTLWPLKEYLDIKASQSGFDDYKALRREGLDVIIPQLVDKNDEVLCESHDPGNVYLKKVKEELNKYAKEEDSYERS